MQIVYSDLAERSDSSESYTGVAEYLLGLLAWFGAVLLSVLEMRYDPSNCVVSRPSQFGVLCNSSVLR